MREYNREYNHKPEVKEYMHEYYLSRKYPNLNMIFGLEQLREAMKDFNTKEA